MPITPTTTQSGLSFPSQVELGGADTTALSDGEWAYTSDTKTTWRLDRSATSGGVPTPNHDGQWLPFTGGSGGSPYFTSGAPDPNGTVTPAGPLAYYVATGSGTVWQASDGTNVGWRLIATAAPGALTTLSDVLVARSESFLARTLFTTLQGTAVHATTSGVGTPAAPVWTATNSNSIVLGGSASPPDPPINNPPASCVCVVPSEVGASADTQVVIAFNGCPANFPGMDLRLTPAGASANQLIPPQTYALCTLNAATNTWVVTPLGVAAPFVMTERYVDLTAPAGGDGSAVAPFNTIAAAIASIPGAPNKLHRYAVMLAPGIYAENVALRPWAFLVGTDAFVTRLTGTLSLPPNLWNPADNPDDNFTDMRCGFQGVTITAAQTFDFNVGAQPGSSFQGSNEGKLYWTDCICNSLLTLRAFSLINQVQGRLTQFFGGIAQEGMQVQLEESAITGGGPLTISDTLNITGGPIPAIFNAFGGATNGPVSVTSANGALATVILQGFALSSTLALTGAGANLSYTSSPEGIPKNPTFSGGVGRSQITLLNDGYSVAYTSPAPSPFPLPVPADVNDAITTLAGVAIFSGDIQVVNGVSRLVSINGFPVDQVTTAAPPAGYFFQSDGTKWIAAPSGSGPNFAINSFTSPAGTLLPVGTSLAPTITFDATYNMVATSAQHTATEGPSPVVWPAPYSTVTFAATYTSNIVNHVVTFTLTATDATPQSATRQLQIQWTTYIRWDQLVDPGPAGYTAAFIEGLANQSLQTTFNANVTMNVAAGHYAFEAFPTAYGTPTFYITQTGQPQNPFAGGASKVVSAVPILVNGVTVPMDLYRSDFPSLGSNSFLTK